MPVTVHPRGGLVGPFIGFALSLLIPSTAIFQKYTGLPGVVAYLILATWVLFLLIRYRDKLLSFMARITEKQALWLAGLTVFIMLIAFVLVYPVANSGAGGRGSDGDDALNVAVHELLRGRYPYYPQTYLGNPISPLPGALFLAIPFVLLGSSAYQNLFWLAAFIFVMKSYLKDGRQSLLLVWVILIFSPVVVYQVLTGYDYIANGLYVLLFMLWMVSIMPRSDMRSWQKALLAGSLGIGLSSRANFCLVLPLLLAALVQKAGWKPAIKYITITCMAWIAITIPFYLYDPQGFTPLQTVNELDYYRTILPYAGFIIPFATGLIAIALAITQSVRHDLSILFRNCAVVLAFPVLCGMILSSVESGMIDFSFALFGTFFLFYGAVAFYPDLFGNRG
jgi:hypothetical protein